MSTRMQTFELTHTRFTHTHTPEFADRMALSENGLTTTKEWEQKPTTNDEWPKDEDNAWRIEHVCTHNVKEHSEA